MTNRFYGRLWKLWGCIGWFNKNDFKILGIQMDIYNPELEYVFMFSFQIAKFVIEFGLDT